MIFRRRSVKIKQLLSCLMKYQLKIKKHKYLKDLRGDIVISHYRGHDIIILFFEIKGWRKQHIRLLSKSFGYW